MTQEVDQKQRILKAVVIILGILLLISFAVVAITIVSRLSTMGKDEVAEAGIIEEVAVTPDFGATMIEIPAGGRIGGISADGKTLFLVIDRPGGQETGGQETGGQEIIVIDHWSGRERGRIELVPEAE